MSKERALDRVKLPNLGQTMNSDALISQLVEKEADLFSFRRQIELGIQTGAPECTCWYCDQPVRLICRCLNTTTYYFRHVYHNVACPRKIPRTRSAKEIKAGKYKGAAEGSLHREVKQLVASVLANQRDVLEVRTEKYVISERTGKRRRPDVLVRFASGMLLVIEVQHSREFLSVIIGRERFYHEHGIYVLWVLPPFSPGIDAFTFTKKDIFYGNRQCVFTVDEEAEQMSKEAGELILTCHHQVGDGAMSNLMKSHASLRDLAFDPQNFRVYLEPARK